MHKCHANGCEVEEIHLEIPFCKKHWKMLPKPHQDKLWKERVHGECGLCQGFKDAPKDWLKFANLGIALLCQVEYGEHDCPSELQDEDGFCWGCGVNHVVQAYTQATKIIEKYKMKVG